MYYILSAQRGNYEQRDVPRQVEEVEHGLRLQQHAEVVDEVELPAADDEDGEQVRKHAYGHDAEKEVAFAPVESDKNCTALAHFPVYLFCQFS